MRFCIICAAPRSGTTLLGQAVCDAYQMRVAGEIFYEVTAKMSGDAPIAEDWWLAKFFRFRAAAIRQRPGLIYPDNVSRRQLFDLYLDHLRATFRSDRLLLDIKYTSWHHFDGAWRGPTDPPGLIELIREKQIPVVHLIRQNLFDLYCSMQMAQRDGIWEIVKPSDSIGDVHQTEAREASKTRTLIVHLEGCREWMANMATSQKLYAKWLYGFPVHTLTYEKLLDKGRFTKNVSDVFTNAFGCPPVQELTTKYVKILPPLDRVVENAQEVLDYFSGTDFEISVRASLEGKAYI